MKITRTMLRFSYINFVTASLFGPLGPLVKRGGSAVREYSEINRLQPQESWSELRLGVSFGRWRPNDLDCGRARLRTAFYRARRWNANCVRGTWICDLRIWRRLQL